MKKWYGWQETLHYKIDNMFSKGTPITILWLGIISLIIVLLASLFIVYFQLSPDGLSIPTFFDAFWQTSMHAINPGEVDIHAARGYQLIMFLVTIVSLLVTSTFIGLIATGLNQYIDVLQRGRSKVIEENHVVILGWNNQVFTIIEELVSGNISQSDRCIVVMGNRDKKEMEQLINDNVDNLDGIRIVVRTGDPIVPNSLDILNLGKSKAIIILSPDRNDPDSEVIKICLAITKQPDFETRDYHIVAEMRDPKNLDVVNVLGKGKISWIPTGEIIARITAQTSRQSGLSIVYTDLLDFAGDEIYFYPVGEFSGLSFGECLNLFEKNAVMGVVPFNESPIMNPPMSYEFKDGDEIFVLAEDADKILPHFSETIPIKEDLIRTGDNIMQMPERFLMIGWNWRAPMVLTELDHYVPQGSTITVFCDQVLMGESVNFQHFQFENLTLKVKYGDTTNRRVLDEITCHRYSHILLLCYSNSLPPQLADAKTLITLLHLRDIIGKDDQCHFSITSEMMDTKDCDLAEVTKPDDFVISTKIISLMFSQIAENRERKTIFADIFNQEGNEIYLKPIEHYVSLEEPVNFFTIVESARRRNEIAIGFRRFEFLERAEKNFGVVLNPKKSEEMQFISLDKVIVISEN